MSDRSGKTIRIAGGGLAGLSLAVGLLRRGIPVEVHETGSLPRHRVCGEFVAGVGERTLGALGIESFFAEAVEQRTVAWFRKERRVLQKRLPKAVPGISRAYFDDALAGEIVANGGAVHFGSRIPVERLREEPGWVWAAGRESDRDGWRGYKAHYRGLATGADLEVHLGAGAYIGISHVEGGRCNVCGLFRNDHGRGLRTAGALPELARRTGLSGLAARLEASEEIAGTAVGVAGVNTGRNPPSDGLLRLGDAYGVIPPFTGNGMSMALESAESALAPLEAYCLDRISWESCVGKTRSALDRRFRRRLAVARLLHHWLLDSRRQSFAALLARGGILPFGYLYALTH